MLLTKVVFAIALFVRQAADANAYVDPAAVTELPSSVRTQLLSRGCLIPRSTENNRAATVVRGALYKTGPGTDWAVYCSRPTKGGRRSTLFVFGASRGYAADSTGFVMRDRVDTPSPGRSPDTKTARLATSLTLTGKDDLNLLFEAPRASSRPVLQMDERGVPRHEGLLDQLDKMVLIY